MLSSDIPNLDSPANVDAAKEVRTDLEGRTIFDTLRPLMLTAYVLSLQEESATVGTQKCGGMILVPHLDLVGHGNWSFLSTHCSMFPYTSLLMFYYLL